MLNFDANWYRYLYDEEMRKAYEADRAATEANQVRDEYINTDIDAMEEIANMVKDEPQKATELLDEKVVNALNTIVNTDSSKLAGPTAEQIAAREKLMKGEKLSEAEQKLATTITPMEQAERNKSYAMFTSSIMQKLYQRMH